MLRIRRSSRLLSLLISLTLLIGLLSPLGFAEGKDFSVLKSDVARKSLSKIMPELAEDLEKEEVVEALIYMKDRVDTRKVANATKRSLSIHETAHKAKLSIRNEVVEALRNKAETSQDNLLGYLRQEAQRGNVEEFESYHIVNMIYIKAKKEVVKNLAYMEEVETIYKNKTLQLEGAMIGKEISTSNLDDEVGWNVKKVNADEVWYLENDGSGTVVGVLDSGMDWTHPAIKNQWRGYNSDTEEVNPIGNWFDPFYGQELPEDLDGHGTHVTGTIVGQEADGSNKIGVAPGAKWIGARVFDHNGSTTAKVMLSAAEWIIAPGGNPDLAPDVVNNSWGGLDGIDSWFRDAVKAWRDAGIVPVFAAGNQRFDEPEPWPGSISVPSNYPESFAVAATDINDIRGSFSKLGPSPYDETLIKPEISAPGVDVLSSMPGGGYAENTGTSMAAPAVSGVVALVIAANSGLNVDDIESLLMQTSRPLTDPDYPMSPNMAYGYGLVDALEAILQVAGGVGTLKGRVVQEGEDLENAVINHQQEVFENFIFADIDIRAQVSDDVGVTEVELLVKPDNKPYWFSTPMDRLSGNHKDGIYEATITGELLSGEKTKYRIKARDYAGEEVITDEYEIDIIFGVLPDQYEEGFEDDPIGWLATGSWEWGEKADFWGPSSYKGDKFAGTNLSGYYPNYADDWLISPPIDLRDNSLSSPVLVFHEWYVIENVIYPEDKGHLLITNDYGKSWRELRPYISGDSNYQWQESVIDLSPYKGSKNPIYVAFRLESNEAVWDYGWYIDEVKLIGTGEGLLGEIPDSEVESENLYFDLIGLRSNETGVKDSKYKIVENKYMQGAKLIEGPVIPVDNAIVSILETGRSMKVNPSSGEFNMRVPEGEYTLKAEAYGFYSQEVRIETKANDTINHTFKLEKKPQSRIIGKIIDRQSREGIANALIRIVEDGNISPVRTDANGDFIIEGVYEGEYTISIRADGFEPKTYPIEMVGGQEYEFEIDLNKFIGSEREIKYDNGMPTTGIVANFANYGMAVRFTPNKFGKVLGAKIFFQGIEWPQPGGNEIGIAIVDTDDWGRPTGIVDEFKLVDIKRSSWNVIDLSEYNFTTDKDFFIATYQIYDGDYSPAIGVDETSSSPERSYIHAFGEVFDEMANQGISGGLMIRALFEETVGPPRINNLEEINYVNQDFLSLEGSVAADGKINIYVNEEIQTSVEAKEGKFTAQIELPLEENIISARFEKDGFETVSSETVKVIKDKVAPSIEIYQPSDEAKINSESVKIVGRAWDNMELIELGINGIGIELDEEGNFSKKMLLDPGKNIIEINAIDRAGNETIIERTVFVNLETPEIRNIQPAEDLELRPGEVLNVCFEAAEGGKGYFRLNLPTMLGNHNIGIPMVEEKGLYTGTWTVPENISVDELSIKLIYINEFGQEVSALAEGRLTIVSVSDMKDLPSNTIVLGEEAFHVAYLENNGEIMEKINTWKGPIYIKLDKDTLVDQDGNLVDIKVLPREVRYYDKSGNIVYYRR